MPRTRKQISPQKLHTYDVLIEDSGPRSQYFKLSQFDGYFTGGRNAFLVAGSTALKASTKILVEILDSTGKAVFSTPVKNFSEANSKLVQAEVYEDTPIGTGKLVILGCTTTYADGTPIPVEWQDKYNVRWISDITISPKKENVTPIRFRTPPKMVVREKFYFSPESSSFASAATASLDIKLDTKFFNVYPNGYLLTCKGTPTERYFNIYRDGVITGSLDIARGSGREFVNVHIPITKIYNRFTAESDGTVLQSTAGTRIDDLYISASGQYTAILNKTEQVSVTSSIQLQYTNLTVENTGSILSFADIRVVDLATLSGEVHAVQVSYKRTTDPGEFIVLSKIPTQVRELLAVDTGSRIAPTGLFRDINIKDYWYSTTMSLSRTGNELPPERYYTASQVTPATDTSLQSCFFLLDAVTSVVPIVSGSYANGVAALIGTREQNPLELFPRTEYTLQFDALVSRTSGSVTLNQPDYSVDVYLIPLSGSSVTLLDTNTRGQLLGTLTPEKNFAIQNFETVELNFSPNIITSGEFGIRFIIYGGFWNIANVSVKPATEPLFSPDEIGALVRSELPYNELITYRAEYLDINNNSVGFQTTALPTFFQGTPRPDVNFATSASYALTASYAENVIIPNGLISQSSQVIHNLTTGYVSNEHINHLGVTISAGAGLSGGGNIAASRTLVLDTSSVHFSQGVVKQLPNNLVSSSTQIDYTTVTNIPPGIVSSSGQVKTLLPPGAVSSSTQVNYTQLGGVPSGIVSSSTQINYTQLSNIPLGIVSGAAQVKTLLPSGSVSSSTQVNLGDAFGTASWATNATNLQQAIRTESVNYTIVDSDYLVLANPTASITITLPSAAARSGRRFRIKSITTSPLAVIAVTTVSQQLIDGELRYDILSQNDWIEVISDGSNWRITSREETTPATVQALFLYDVTDALASATFTRSSPAAQTVHTIPNPQIKTYTGEFVGPLHGTASRSVVAEQLDILSGGNPTGTGIYSGSFSGNLVGTASYALNTPVGAGLPAGVVSSSTQVIHSLTTGYVSNEHIDHTAVSITAGGGLSGGGNIATTRTLSLDTASVHFTSGTVNALPSGTISASTQVVHSLTTGYVSNEHINHTAVSITAGSGLSGGGNISATRTLSLDTSSAHFTGGTVKALPVGTVSASSQVAYSQLTGIPVGIVSGAAQVKTLLPAGSVSASSQVTYNQLAGIPTGIISSSTQVNYTQLSNIPSGIVSGAAQVKTLLPAGSVSASSQVSYTQLSNIPSGIVSGAAQVKTLLPDGSISASSQVTYSQLTGIPSGIVSGAAQVKTLLPDGSVSASSQVNLGNAIGTASRSVVAEQLDILSGGNPTGTGIYSGSFSGNLEGTASYALSAGLPVGTVSASSQVVHSLTTGYVSNEHINHTAVSITAGSGLSGGGNISATRTLSLDTASVHFTSGTVNALPIGTVSASSQVTYSQLTGIPVGIVSGAAQVKTLLPAGSVSASSQVSYTQLSSIPSGIVSGAAQVKTLLPAGSVSASSQVTYSQLTGIPAGIVSGAAQIPVLLPAGSVSSSTQINLGSAVGTASLASLATNVQYPVRTESGNYTLASTDYLVLANSTASATITLPTAVGASGRNYRIKRITSSSQVTITVATTSAQTIDGELTYSLIGSQDWVEVTSDGTNWRITSSEYTQLSSSDVLFLYKVTDALSSSVFTRTSPAAQTVYTIPNPQIETYTGEFVGPLHGTASRSIVAEQLDILAGGNPTGTGIYSGSFNGTLTGILSGSATIAVNTIRPVRVESGSYSITVNDYMVLSAPTASATITLPTAAGNIGRNYRIKRVTSTPSARVYIHTTSSQSINGELTYELLSTNDWIEVISDGSNWRITSKYEAEITNFSLFSYRVGDPTSNAVFSRTSPASVAAFDEYITGYPAYSGSFTGNLEGTASYALSAGLPVGTVSASSQVVHSLTTGYVSNEHVNHTSVSITAGNGLSGGGNIAATRTLSLDTSSAHFTGGTVKALPVGTVSASSQVNYTQLGSIPAGIVSGAAQVKTLLPAGSVSASSQVTYNQLTGIPTGIVSSSTQVNYTQLSSIPVGIVSGAAQVKTLLPAGSVSASSQITYTQLTGIPSGIVSGAAQVKTLLPDGSVSASSQVTYTQLTGIPSGIVSGAAQVKTLLPAGSVSASSQVNLGNAIGTASRSVVAERLDILTGGSPNGTGVYSGSFSGTLFGTASHVTVSNLPAGIVSSSTQVNYTQLSSIPVGIVSGAAQVKTLLPAGSVSASSQVNLSQATGIAPSASLAINTQYPVRTETGNYTIAIADYLILANPSTTGSITLPTAVGNTGRNYRIKRITTSSTATVTVTTTSSQTIDGETTYTLLQLNDWIEVMSDGSNWRITSLEVSPISSVDVLFMYTSADSLNTAVFSRTSPAASTIYTPPNPQVSVYTGEVIGTLFGTVRSPVRVESGTYAATPTDYLILANPTVSCSIALPSAVPLTGKAYKIKRTTTILSSLVIINTTSSQTIDGELTYNILSTHGWIEVMSDGSNWQIISREDYVPDDIVPLFSYKVGDDTTSATFTRTSAGTYSER